MKRKMITVLLVLAALLFLGCNDEDCSLLIGEYTQQKGSDVIKKVRVFTSLEVPEGYTDNHLSHIFIVEGTNCD